MTSEDCYNSQEGFADEVKKYLSDYELNPNFQRPFVRYFVNSRNDRRVY